MIVRAIRTKKVTTGSFESLEVFLKEHISTLKNRSVVAISSKVVSIIEGRTVERETSIEELVHNESQFYIPASENPYKISLSITNDILIPNAGIDDSNSNGSKTLWPKNPVDTANRIQKWLKETYAVDEIGIIIIDSTVRMLKWGTTGITIGYSGIKPLKDYRGQQDLFGKKMVVSQLNILDTLASAATLEMGEGAEQTPIALMEDLKLVSFTNKATDLEEIESLRISKEEDLYSPLLDSDLWKKGTKTKE